MDVSFFKEQPMSLPLNIGNSLACCNQNQAPQWAFICQLPLQTTHVSEDLINEEYKAEPMLRCKDRITANKTVSLNMLCSLLNDIPVSSNRFSSEFSNDTISYHWEKKVRNGLQEETLPTRSCLPNLGYISVSCAHKNLFSEDHIPDFILRPYPEILYHVTVFHPYTELGSSNYALMVVRNYEHL